MDLIERQGVLDICQKTYWNGADDYYPISARGIAEKVKGLPSVEPPTGTWEEKEVMSPEDSKAIEQWQSARCSVCGCYQTKPYLYGFHESNFCPNCGSRNGGKS